MTTRIIRRATLTALVFVALAGTAAAQTTPPTQPGQPGHRMEHRSDRMHMHREMRMRGGMGGTLTLLGVVPMRSGQEIQFSEGRLAFLKAELKITEGQTKQWDAFAAALRENVAKLNEAYKAPDREAMQKLSPAERLGWFEKAITTRLDAVKRSRAAMEPLYAALSDDQKKMFDRFIPTSAMRGDFRERMQERRERRGQQPGQPGQPGQPQR